VAAISPITSITAEPGVSCFKFIPSASLLGELSELGNGYCAQGSQRTDYVSLFDINQIEAVDASSCAQLCESVFGNGLEGITIYRNPTEANVAAPYTGGGNFQCQCHVDLVEPTDPKIAMAQSFEYKSGQGFASFDASLSGTDVTTVVYAENHRCFKYYPSRRMLIQESENFFDEDLRHDNVAQETQRNDAKTQKENKMMTMAMTLEQSFPYHDHIRRRSSHETLPSPTQRESPTTFPATTTKARTLHRNLQQGTAQISGAGIGTLKFTRRVYKRNLLTGEEGWSTKIGHLQRKLQVGKAEFNVDLQVVTSNRDYEFSSSSPPTTFPGGPLLKLSSLLLTSLMILQSCL
jgi:hypothetical protein